MALFIQRRPGQSIQIGGQVELTVTAISDGGVTLAIGRVDGSARLERTLPSPNSSLTLGPIEIQARRRSRNSAHVRVDAPRHLHIRRSELPETGAAGQLAA
jgi:sRNA-binding carbon storage regulator CsrA